MTNPLGQFEIKSSASDAVAADQTHQNLLADAYSHVRQSWKDVLHGNASTAQYLEVAGEAVGAAALAYGAVRGGAGLAALLKGEAAAPDLNLAARGGDEAATKTLNQVRENGDAQLLVEKFPGLTDKSAIKPVQDMVQPSAVSPQQMRDWQSNLHDTFPPEMREKWEIEDLLQASRNWTSPGGPVSESIADIGPHHIRY